MRPLDTFREFAAEVSGRRMAWLEWGPVASDRPPLLLLHDLRGQSHLWDPVAGGLSERRVIALDLRGHGDSDHVRPPAYTPPDYRADLDAFLDLLEVRRCAVVGHGAGGSLGLMLAGAHPKQVERLVLVDVAPNPAAHDLGAPGLGTPDSGATGVSAAAPAAGGHVPLRDFGALREAARAGAPAASESVIDWLVPYLFRPAGEGQEPKWDPDLPVRSEGWKISPWLARVRCPVLVLRGAASVALSEPAAVEMAEGLDDARVETVVGAGHAVMVEQPDRFLEAVLPFLQQQPPASAPGAPTESQR